MIIRSSARRRCPLLLAAALVVPEVGLVGCDDDAECVSAPLVATPVAATAGGTISLSTEGFNCGNPPALAPSYQLYLSDASGPPATVIDEAAPDRTGAFRVDVTVPSDTPIGAARIFLLGTPYDPPCPDGGTCQSFGADFAVTA